MSNVNGMIKVTPAGKNFIKSMMQENKQLKQRLEEKDKEIERLKQENDKLALALAEEPDKDELLQLKQDFDILYNKTKERDRSIRKQVCEEIRDFIQKNESPSFSQSLCGYWFISAKKLFEYLDQIEQAKENIK